ncbi:Hypothetical Protein CTN_1274 [Thermotoga neapolitana DSM 4359]|nr:Hypothetical Protein CTN_1274 [Thermotoga neapolitana DSM 4359]
MKRVYQWRNSRKYLRICDLLREIGKMETQKEIVFIAVESEDGGYIEKTERYSIFTQGDTWEELLEMIKDAVKCHFDEGAPKYVHARFVKDVTIAV